MLTQGGRLIASVPKTLLGVLAVCMVSAFPAVAFSAGPEIFLLEEPESYLVIDKLEGLGILPALMTGDRGLEAWVVSREAGNAEATGDPVVDGMVRFLRLDYESDFDLRLRAGLEYSRKGQVPPNAQGIPVLEDGGIRAGGFFRWRPAEWLGLQARGDLLAGANGGRFGRLEETSVRLGWPQATLEAGRFSLWWGPGRHGALLFTTNAQPLVGIRIRNPYPILFGSWFRFLGLFQYDLFFARLDEDRPIPHSILSGVRLAIKPTPWLEIGASRAMQYGGEGMKNGISAWWEAFKGTKSNNPGNEDNQLGGFDIAVTLPFRAQPVRLYMEMAGEDQAEGQIIPLPSKWAVLSGVFLPTIGRNARWDFRVEFATNQIRGNGPAWYVHPSYPHEYHGQTLGHHMGTDARDLFLEAHYFLLPSSYIEANIDLTQRDFPGPEREETWRVSGAVVAWLTPFLRGEGRLAYEEVSNEGGISGNGSRDMTVQVGISYNYR